LWRLRRAKLAEQWAFTTGPQHWPSRQRRKIFNSCYCWRGEAATAIGVGVDGGGGGDGDGDGSGDGSDIERAQ
jgi:hypothetical protein